ncbi:MAG: hypothetical protein WC417_02550 [Candidatus Omnitrophota bacterium]|jgi:phenylacetate-CoA ligase
MAVEFRIEDFVYPFSTLRLHSLLEKSQWFNEDELTAYQMERLEIILKHAYENVPYYRKLFNDSGVGREKFKDLEDLKKIPPINKEILRNNFNSLRAKNFAKFKPRLCRTSGTSGEPIEFYHDKPSNNLEFCYYWRYWSWGGYRLGDSFAEFTLYHFLGEKINRIGQHALITNRLMLNPAQLSYENIGHFCLLIDKYRPSFLKGSPSSIYVFVNLVEKKHLEGLRFKAVFTTGELLLPYQQQKIESVLKCKIFDSYGHMERTVAICQCPEHNYHINSDYGILEIEKDERLSSPTTTVGRLIGTSLYNFAMPLIRYRIDDIIAVKTGINQCPCGRGLPLCERIDGRKQDIIVTPDGRLLTNVFILFDLLKGVLWTQLIQKEKDELTVKIVRGNDYSEHGEQEFKYHLQKLAGERTKIEIEYLPADTLSVLMSQKYRPIVGKFNF